MSKAEYYGFLELLRNAEDVLGADFHAIVGVDYDHTGVAYTKGGIGIANEVIGSGAVYDIEFLAVEFGIHYCREYRIAIFFFYREVIGYGIAATDCTSSFYNSTLEEHRLGECGFSSSLRSQKGYVFDFLGAVNLHWYNDFDVTSFGDNRLQTGKAEYA